MLLPGQSVTEGESESITHKPTASVCVETKRGTALATVIGPHNLPGGVGGILCGRVTPVSRRFGRNKNK